MINNRRDSRCSQVKYSEDNNTCWDIVTSLQDLGLSFMGGFGRSSDLSLTELLIAKVLITSDRLDLEHYVCSTQE